MSFDQLELRREHSESLVYEEWADRMSAPPDEIGPEDPGAAPPLGDESGLVAGDAPGTKSEVAA